ncbi:MAG: hypothetical protein K0Q79_795 [Flavipsychrobacter sp.]|jgi:hypothetical protein|nr:hypothetical protein [Flavipsychrobacter sp.]
MKRIAVYSLLAVMLVIAGCPVLTKNSIDNGSYDVPAWLPGKWQEVDKDGKPKTSAYLLEKGSGKGKLKYYDIKTDGTVDRATGRDMILSSIDGNIYLSAYTPADDMSEEGYYLFRLRKVSNTEMVLDGIKEHAIDYEATQADIKKFITNAKEDAAIYEATDSYTYKKK